jgi:tRNA(Ile)-lysidine synthase
MALLAVLASLHASAAEPAGLVVAHLDHRLRGWASDRDALFVASSARAAGLDCVVGTVAGSPPHGRNLEAWAREERYAFLARVARGVRADATCVAHTRDDQAETVLLRLGRGAGPRALAGMEPRRKDAVVRPLLDRTRSECAGYLRARGGIAVRDATNDDERRMRSRLRRRVLPALEAALGVDVGGRLARLAHDLRVESDLAERFLVSCLPAPGDGARLPIERVVDSGAAAGRLLHAWLVREGLRPSERQVWAVARLARGPSPSAGVDIGAGWRVARRYDALEIVPPSGDGLPTAWSPVELTLPGETRLPNGWWVGAALLPPRARPDRGPRRVRFDAAGEAVMLAADALALPLVARRARPGDRIRLGRGHRKLADVLIDARVPRRERATLFVVTSMDDTLLWVPGVVVSPWAEAQGRPGGRIELAAWCGEKGGSR